MANRTVLKHKDEVSGEVYRLANRGYALGYAIEKRRGNNYITIEDLGWVTEANARAFFHKYMGIE